MLVGYGSKRKPQRFSTGFGLFFLLPIGFLGYPFLTHGQFLLQLLRPVTWLVTLILDFPVLLLEENLREGE